MFKKAKLIIEIAKQVEEYKKASDIERATIKIQFIRKYGEEAFETFFKNK